MRHFGCCFTSFLMLLAIVWQADDAYAQGDSGFKYIEVQVVGPDGKPLADVAVDVKIDGMEFPMPTDEEGKISLNAPSAANSRLQLSVKNDKFAAVSASWQGGDSFPEEFSISLVKGNPIGGLVHDEKGEPIEGVKIEATIAGNSAPDGKLQPLLQGHLATTDEAGRWQILTDTETERRLFFKLSHEDYVSNASYGQRATWEQLKKLDHVLVLEKGIELRGRVTNAVGEPIAGALVFLGGNRYISSKDKQKKTTKTDADGKYHFGNVASGNTVVTVSAKGWAPELRTVSAKREMEPADFQLEVGKSIHLLVTDPDGVPIVGAGVAVENWQGQQTLPHELYRSKTNAEGIWQSESMPDDAVDFSLFKQGYMSSRNNKLAASEEPHTIVLQWPLVVSGKVVDAETGLPLEKYAVVPGIDWGNANQQVHWERYNSKQGAGGKYQMDFTEPRAGHFVRIEAAGYRPSVSRAIRDDEGEVTINFEMEEGTGPSGTVKTPDGKPAVGATLMVATREEGLYFHNGEAQTDRGKPSAIADEQGKYTFSSSKLSRRR